jgi:hypothetical protein
MITNYILDEQGNVVPIQLMDELGNPLIENMLKWSEWLQTAERHIGDNDFGDIRVSTVFLSSPHVSLHSDAPMLYETMVFADEVILQRLLELSESDDRSIISKVLGGVDIQIRYATKEEAIQGHARICNFIEVCITNGLIEVAKPEEN